MERRKFLRSVVLGSSAVAASAGPGLWAQTAKPAVPCKPETLPHSPGLTRYVSEFIAGTKYEDIPAEVIARGKKTLLDAFGVGLAGSVSEPGKHVRLYLSRQGWLQGRVSIWGTAYQAPARFAALANGISIHADDFDDTGSSLHSSAPLLPAVAAYCELGRRSGKDLMTAFHVGVEVENKIGDAISPRHKASGFHTTGTCGVFGSAAASAKLLGLGATETAMALGIAGSEASGLRRNYGTMTKPFNAGHAAEGGVAAADLAASGFTAAGDILEAPLGFFQAYGGTYTPHLIAGRLGNPWMFLTPGDMIKRFPCGTIQQPVMDLTLRLVRENHIQADDVAQVEVGGNQRNINTLMRHHPQDGLQAKFSMEFAVAVILVDGKAGLAQFTDASVRRPDMQAMIERVHFYRDPRYDRRAAEGADIQAVLLEPSVVTIHLKSGRTLSAVTQPQKGSPQNPMSYDEVAEKFRGNAEYAQWPARKAEYVIETVAALEKLSDVTPLMRALTGVKTNT